MNYRCAPASATTDAPAWLPVEQLHPRASLHDQSEAPLHALMADIRRNGLQRPVLVRRNAPGRYTIVSGNRRLLACRRLGMTHLPAVVLPALPPRHSAQALLDALLARRLHYLEEAALLRLLNQDHGLSRQEIAQALGVTAQAVGERLALNGLSEPLQAYLMEEGLPERIARMLLPLPDDGRRMAIARRAVRERLCVRDVAVLVSAALTRPGGRRPAPTPHGGQHIVTLMRDTRPYVNAIRSITGQMRDAGLAATLTECRAAGQTTLTVTFPHRRRRTDRPIRERR